MIYTSSIENFPVFVLLSICILYKQPKKKQRLYGIHKAFLDSSGKISFRYVQHTGEDDASWYGGVGVYGEQFTNVYNDEFPSNHNKYVFLKQRLSVMRV